MRVVSAQPFHFFSLFQKMFYNLLQQLTTKKLEITFFSASGSKSREQIKSTRCNTLEGARAGARVHTYAFSYFNNVKTVCKQRKCGHYFNYL